MSEKNRKLKSKDKNIFSNVPTISDVLLPDVLKEIKDYTYLGHNKYSRHFVLTIFPEQTWIGWLDDLFHIGNINISVKIDPTSNGTVINQLTRKLVQHQSQYETYRRQGNITHTPELEKVIADLEELRLLIQTNQDKLYLVTVFITLNAKDLNELNEKTLILESELNKKTSMIRCLIFRQTEGLKNVLPLGDYPIQNYERNMVAGSVASMIPISNPNLSHNDGVFIGRNMFTAAPVYINTFIGPPALPNPHVFICGTSGGGKSVALKTLTARNVITNGTGAFFIDIEGEYTNLCRQLGGKVIKVRQGESAGINPFELEPDTKGNKEFLNILDKVAEIRALLATICRNYMGRTLNATEITEIEIVVNRLYAEREITSDINSLYTKNGGRLDNGKYVVGRIKKKMPTLSDFQKKLKERENCTELAQLLVPFLKGNSLGIFDCESKITSDEDIVSFDMSEIKDEFTKLYASFVILTWVWQKFVLKNRDKKKIILCDEAWLFLKYQESAEFLVNVARRGRKYNVPLFIGSQFIDEFLNSEERKNNNKYLLNKILIQTITRFC